LSRFRINIHRTMHAGDASPHIRPCVPLRKLDLNISTLHGSIEATGESRSASPWDWGMGALSSGELGDSVRFNKPCKRFPSEDWS
jgi:hypothetical protein